MFNKLGRKEAKSLVGILLTLPALIVLIGTVIYPFLYSLNLSFHSFSILSLGSEPDFIGLKNYVKVLTSEKFLSSLLHTFEFVIATLIVELLIGFIIALVLNKDFKGSKLFRVIIAFPLMIAPVVAGLQWKWLFAGQYGIINNILNTIGLEGPLWLGSTLGSRAAILISNLWLASPFVIIILIAGLSNLPDSPFEAAKIDGASPFQVFWYVTLPLLRPSLLIILIVRLTDAFRIFDLIYILTQGGPAGSTEVISTYIYKEAFNGLHLSKAAAASFIMVIILGIFSFIIFKVIRPEEGVSQ